MNLINNWWGVKYIEKMIHSHHKGKPSHMWDHMSSKSCVGIMCGHRFQITCGPHVITCGPCMIIELNHMWHHVWDWCKSHTNPTCSHVSNQMWHVQITHVVGMVTSVMVEVVCWSWLKWWWWSWLKWWHWRFTLFNEQFSETVFVMFLCNSKQLWGNYFVGGTGSLGFSGFLRTFHAFLGTMTCTREWFSLFTMFADSGRHENHSQRFCRSLFFWFSFSGNQIVRVSSKNKGVTTHENGVPGVET